MKTTYDYECEEYVIGTMINYPDVIPTIRKHIVKSDFYDPDFQKFYDIMLHLLDNDTPVDIMQINKIQNAPEHKEYYKTKKLISNYYNNENPYLTSNIEHYCNELKQISGKKQRRKQILNIYDKYKDIDVSNNSISLDEMKADISNLHYDIIENGQSNHKAYTDYLLDLIKDLDKQKDIGFKLNGFNKIYNDLNGIQPGYYIIAAKPNIGKTNFALSLMRDLLLSNPDITILFYSLDDDKRSITFKIISQLSRKPIEDVIKKPAEFLETYKSLFNYANDKRLIVKDVSDVNFEQMENEICYYCNKKPNKVVVFIDAVYNLTIDTDFAGIRELNEERANRLKRMVNKYQIPLITTSEIRKAGNSNKNVAPILDDLKETGKYGYNANLVWMLYPVNEEDVSNPEKIELDLCLKFEKNKISGYKGIRKLILDRNTCIIKGY